MTSHRHSSPSAPPLDDDNLLCEIFLRLPPQPSSLPRASAVCKRWRHLLSDPRFLCRFRIHHRSNPPLLGFFVMSNSGISFVPTMEAHNCAPPGRLSLQLHGLSFRSFGCRNGLALLICGQKRHHFFVWDAVTGDKHHLPFPPWLFDLGPNTVAGINAAVLRAVGDVHFQVVFVATNMDTRQVLACLYSSETGVWGDLISTPIPSEFPNVYPDVVFLPSNVLVGNSIYWIVSSSTPKTYAILEFDLKSRSLAVIPVPVEPMFKLGQHKYRVMRAEGGELGILYLSSFTAQLWRRKTDCDGVYSWVLGRTIELDKLLSLNTGNGWIPLIRGFAENNNVVFLETNIGVFMVHLESLKFKNLFEPSISPYYHPLECVYTAGIGGEHDADDLLHNT